MSVSSSPSETASQALFAASASSFRLRLSDRWLLLLVGGLGGSDLAEVVGHDLRTFFFCRRGNPDISDFCVDVWYQNPFSKSFSLHLLGVFLTDDSDDCSNGFGGLRDDALLLPSTVDDDLALYRLLPLLFGTRHY